MDGLNFNFNDLEIEDFPPDQGIALRQKANETIPLRPEEEGNTFEDLFGSNQPDFEDLTGANHSSPPLHTEDVFSSVLPPVDNSKLSLFFFIVVIFYIIIIFV